jgi:salicylate hydroxylase
MGDAAHATTPFQGAGAGQAIEDALVLTSLFQHVRSVGDIYEAFAAFDQVRKPRSQRVVETSKVAGNLYSMTDSRVRESKEEFRRTFETRMKWLWDIDLYAHIDHALFAFERNQKSRQKVVIE